MKIYNLTAIGVAKGLQLLVLQIERAKHNKGL